MLSTFSLPLMHPTQSGFNTIKFGFSPDTNKPVLILDVPNTIPSQYLLEHAYADVAGKGTISFVSENGLRLLRVTITRRQFIQYALAELKRDTDRYAWVKNLILLDAITIFEEKLSPVKKQKPLAKKNINYSDFSEAEQSQSHDLKAQDETQNHIVKPIQHQGKTQYFKIDRDTYLNMEDASYSKLNEIESAVAGWMCLFLGFNQAPVMTPVYKDNQRFGTLSEEIPGYIPASQYLEDHVVSVESLIDAGIAQICIATFLFEDIDANTQNFGWNAQGKLTRLDFDFALSLSMKYKSRGMMERRLKYPLPPQLTFPITKSNIMNLPDIIHGAPLNWIFDDRNLQLPAFRGRLKNDKAFIAKKWTYLFKPLLMGKMLEDIFVDCVPSVKARSLHINYMLNRIRLLKEVLLDIPEFCEHFRIHHEKIFNELSKEFQAYNLEAPEHDLKTVDLQALHGHYVALSVEIIRAKFNYDSDSQPLNRPYDVIDFFSGHNVQECELYLRDIFVACDDMTTYYESIKKIVDICLYELKHSYGYQYISHQEMIKECESLVEVVMGNQKLHASFLYLLIKLNIFSGHPHYKQYDKYFYTSVQAVFAQVNSPAFNRLESSINRYYFRQELSWAMYALDVIPNYINNEKLQNEIRASMLKYFQAFYKDVSLMATYDGDINNYRRLTKTIFMLVDFIRHKDEALLSEEQAFCFSNQHQLAKNFSRLCSEILDHEYKNRAVNFLDKMTSYLLETKPVDLTVEKLRKTFINDYDTLIKNKRSITALRDLLILVEEQFDQAMVHNASKTSFAASHSVFFEGAPLQLTPRPPSSQSPSSQEDDYADSDSDSDSDTDEAHSPGCSPA